MSRVKKEEPLMDLHHEFTVNVPVDEAWRDPGSGEVLIRNEYAGCNAIFDKNLCRNAVRYVDVQPPFDMGVEAVGKIVAVGAGVTEWREGDCVAATRLGSGYREYQIAAA
ncbi:MAG: alcohol dehydrogenase, partial [Actinobacteria bacterium]|nr:alcohol dehydrogenase [Actinomycetota bacterium]